MNKESWFRIWRMCASGFRVRLDDNIQMSHVVSNDQVVVFEHKFMDILMNGTRRTYINFATRSIIKIHDFIF